LKTASAAVPSLAPGRIVFNRDGLVTVNTAERFSLELPLAGLLLARLPAIELLSGRVNRRT